MTVKRIDITDPQHIADFWLWLGMMEAAHRAKALAEKHKVVGMMLMADLIDAQATRAGVNVRTRNIAHAIKSGLRFDAETLIVLNEGGQVWLECVLLDGAESEPQEA